jgi:hypothetical protein
LLLATTAAVGGAAVVAVVPAVALFAAPAAQAQTDATCTFTSLALCATTAAGPAPSSTTMTTLFGPAANVDTRSATNAIGSPDDLLAALLQSVVDSPAFTIVSAIPLLNIFAGNGGDGTAAHPTATTAGS